ncbi:hypothetical protein GGQ73_001699 [Rhizobium skierniewicense]|uniref:Uncharacterized protein n=1 Tax=Rhizobium skierniewicense TaxID=984260 RepID=A0A7W6CAB1_9HYPH|nr:hypothetical protein [Rhizobium skierniewicense]
MTDAANTNKIADDPSKRLNGPYTLRFAKHFGSRRYFRTGQT